MIGLLQRVSRAEVRVAGDVVGAIGPGLMVLVGVQRDDSEATARRLAERMVGYRVFEDVTGRMNLSLKDTGGGLLLVPQFTLAADTKKGTRPSFTPAAPPELGLERFQQLVGAASEMLDKVATGHFGAHMQIELVNDGPVTLWLEV